MRGKICLFLSLCLCLVLVACSEDDSTPPPPQPNTPIAQVQVADSPTPGPTRIITVTPRPSATFTAVPTLDESLLPYEGTWSLLLRYEITESEALGNISYSTLASVNVSFDGFVTGRGAFTPIFQTPTCAAQIVNIDALQYTIRGSLEKAADGVYMNLTLTPDNPTKAESYKQFCADPLDRNTQVESQLEESILMPLLQSANQLTYRFRLDQGVVSETFEGDMATHSNNKFDGQVQGQIQFSRS